MYLNNINDQTNTGDVQFPLTTRRAVQIPCVWLKKKKRFWQQKPQLPVSKESVHHKGELLLCILSKRIKICHLFWVVMFKCSSTSCPCVGVEVKLAVCSSNFLLKSKKKPNTPLPSLVEHQYLVQPVSSLYKVIFFNKGWKKEKYL